MYGLVFGLYEVKLIHGTEIFRIRVITYFTEKSYKGNCRYNSESQTVIQKITGIKSRSP